MLNNETFNKLYKLRLDGFKAALKEQISDGKYEQLPFMERLGLLVDREVELRETRKLQTRITKAKFRQSACIENLDFSIQRELDRSTILTLANCTFIKKGHNILITGPTGIGKSYVSCAIGNKACLNGYDVRYFRTTQFFTELKLARFENRFSKLQKNLAKASILILDDFGLQEMKAQERLDLLDILDDRVYRLSTIIVTQLPIDQWHHMIGDNTIADAIMDRFIHNSYQIQMKGESMRKLKKSLK